MPDHPLEETSALSADDFEPLLKPFFPFSSKCAMGVSGGPDSMALAYCLKRFFPHPVIAFIVDHNLRTTSAEEVSATQESLKRLGIQSEVLRWEHGPVTARLHEQARTARYELLEAACLAHGVKDLFIAHHQEDQAETILMRIAKGSGVEGLAGISASLRRGDIRILRPFLTISKKRLIATCSAANITYIEDPSNNSPKFARGRLRKVMPLLQDQGLSVAGLVTLGERARLAQEALTFYAKEFMGRFVTYGLGGTTEIERASFQALPRAVALTALATCLRFVTHADHPPEYASLSSLCDQIVAGNELPARSFYGCLVSMTYQRISIIREPSAAKDDLALRAGESVFWDRRWLVSASCHEGDQALFRVRALGLQPHAALDRLAPDLRRAIPQGRIRASLPAIFVDQSLYAIPSFGENATFRMIYRKQAFP